MGVKFPLTGLVGCTTKQICHQMRYITFISNVAKVIKQFLALRTHPARNSLGWPIIRRI